MRICSRLCAGVISPKSTGRQSYHQLGARKEVLHCDAECLFALLQDAAADSSSPEAAQQLASEAGSGVRYMPSATAAWRLNLLRSGGLPDAQLAGIRCAA
jgi:hypothetical protein